MAGVEKMSSSLSVSGRSLRNVMCSSRMLRSPVVVHVLGNGEEEAKSMSSEQRVRTPSPVPACHQCCTSPSMNCPRRGAEQVLAREISSRVKERERVLDLIAKNP